MSWKNNFAGNIQFGKLPEIGAFKISEEPEALGKGKFRVHLVNKEGQKKVMSTFEATIGDIVSIPSEWVEAYIETVGKGKDAQDYIRFRAAKE
jgi:hypothetical protein